MGIEKMKLFSCIGPGDKLDEAAALLLSSGMVHFEDAAKTTGKTAGERASAGNPYDKPLAEMAYFMKRMNLDTGECPASGAGGLKEMTARYEETAGDLSKMKERLAALEKESAGLESVLKQLDHLHGIDIDLEPLFHLRFYKFRYGRMSRDKYERLTKYASTDFVYFATALDKEYAWLMYLTPAAFEETVDLTFSKLDFERIRISGDAHGTPDEAREEMARRLAETSEEMHNLEAGLSRRLEQEKDFLCRVYSAVSFAREAYEIRGYASFLSKSFCLTGWVPADRAEELGRQVEAVTGLSFAIEDNKETELTPPTKLKNNRFARPFELFVKMYGMPAYNEIDPTLFVALTYTLLFGAMFGDVGQGLVLAIAGLLLSHRSKDPGAGRILSVLGLSSTLFGFAYGSVFGFEDIIHGIITPMHDINTILAASIGVGMIMITVAMLINIVNGVRQRSYIKSLFGSNGLAGLVLYWAVTVWAIYYLIMNRNIMTTPYGLGLMLLPFTLIFFSEPLSNRLEKKHGHKQSPVEFFLQSFFEGFETVLSYLTNTVSFIRVGAFVLSHAGMMLAVFQLSQTANGGHNWVVVILGNMLVIGFEGFLVGIQVLRLEFFEMFSRFYSGTGKEYAPALTEVKKI